MKYFFLKFKNKLFTKRRLLNSYVSLIFAYLLMIFLLISSKWNYLECSNCGLNYRFLVSSLFIIASGSYQILSLNAYFNQQRKNINFIKYLFIPLFFYFPFSIFLFFNSGYDLYRAIILQ